MLGLRLLRKPRKERRSGYAGADKKHGLGDLRTQNHGLGQILVLSELSLKIDKELEKVGTRPAVLLENGLDEVDSLIRDFPLFHIVQDDGKFSCLGNIRRINVGFPNDFCKLHFKFAPPKNRFTIN